ncbi:MAG: hypothetical protein CIT03_09905 [Methanobacterium sp.]|nr:MAG: hypothetical protein CIT03_09905 [Methanobacterium sp.]
MKKEIILVLMMCALITASGCTFSGTGSGKVINQTKNVSGFDQVSLNGIGTLIISQGNKESLTIEAEDNVIPNINTNINNNKLEISYKPGSPTPTQPVKFHLTVKNLSSIEVSGAGKIDSKKLNEDQLTIFIDGAGEGNLTNLTAKTLTITISGAGKLKLSGTTDTQTITINGAGEYSAPSLTTKTTTITINGAGKATVKVSDILNAIINGGGQIAYFGNPKVNQQINGAGSINRAVN